MYKIIYNCLLFAFVIQSLCSAQTKVLSLKLRTKQLPFGLTEKVSQFQPKVGIALSGGGARSLSQIGILKALVENKIPIDEITGTSMGSIVGGLFSSGYSIDDIDSIVNATDWNEFFSTQQTDRNQLFIDQKVTEDKALITLRLDGFNLLIPKSLTAGQRVANFLTLAALNAPLIADSSFNGLVYDFKAISTDLISGKEVILDNGSLSLAMRASSSVTFLLPPVKKDSLLLVDGGLIANIPVEPLKENGCNFIIASNTPSPLYSRSELKYPWTIADQLVSIPMKVLNEQQLKLADVVITPPLSDRKNTDFSKINDLINEGYLKTESIINLIKDKLKEKFEKNIDEKEFFILNPTLSENPTEDEIVFFQKYIRLDSVSNYQLLFDLNNLFNTGIYESLSIEINEKSGHSILKLNEKKNPVIKKINLRGVSLFPYNVIENYMHPLLNKPYNPKEVIEAALNILRHYKKAGYSLARISKINFDTTSNSLNVSLTEGIISKIIIDGLQKTKQQIITRDFSLREGDFFKYSAAEQGLVNLTSTNLFDNIELFVNVKNNKNTLILHIDEKPSSVLRLGMRIDNENQTQLFIDVRDENLFGTGTELGAVLSGGLRNRSYILEHKATRIFDSYFTYKLRAFYEFNDVNVYKDDSTGVPNRFSRSKTGEYRQIYYGGSFGIGTQVKKLGNLIIEAKYQRDQIKSKYNFLGPTYKVDIASLRATLTIDTQDQYPYPTKGSLLNTYYETAQTALGGDLGYTKAYFNYKSYFGVNENHVFNIRLVGGFADNTLPLSEQFSLGGQNLFFGLRDNEYRGRQIFVSSVGYRLKLPVKIFFDSYLKARYDLGSIWDERSQIRLKDLRHGIGATLSLDTPIGPADFSIGKSFYFVNTLPKNTIVWGPTFFYFTIGFYY
ncbi:BamA/TamA family outer membrane protein [Melioribacteraceae bacterium 4301-Me]|uniref:BamA/TamA family outer membrane protein n=1 Tax=Pyranulibacter aquaticus TaxID=3163344 RepID=UPI00359995F3